MRIDWWTLALQAINVLILIWLLSRFLFRPVMNAIAARQAAADRLIADAQDAKRAALAQEAQAKAANAGLAAEAADRRSAMQAEVEKERAVLLDQARHEAADIVGKGHAAVAAERARLAAQWEEKAATLAGDMACRLVSRLPAAGLSDALLTGMIAAIRALDAEERQRLAAETPLVLASAIALDDAGQAHCRTALAGELPTGATLEFVVDPDLIAGFELRGPHVRVRNNWRADLDAMLAELREQGR